MLLRALCRFTRPLWAGRAFLGSVAGVVFLSLLWSPHGSFGDRTSGVLYAPMGLEPTAAEEGAAFTSSGSVADRSAGRPGASVDYGDGSGSEPLDIDLDGTFSLRHLYADDGVYRVAVTVVDRNGRTASDTTTATVSNVAPTATFTAVGDLANGVRTTDLSMSDPRDPSEADTAAGFRFSFACDGQDSSLASNYLDAGEATAASCPLEDGSLQMVRGRVLDKDDGHTTYQVVLGTGSIDILGIRTPGKRTEAGRSGDGAVDGLVRSLGLSREIDRLLETLLWRFSRGRVLDASPGFPS